MTEKTPKPLELDKLDPRDRKVVDRLMKAAAGVIPRDCPVCGYHGYFAPNGWPPRFDSRCPSCRSLERNRLLFLAIRDSGLPGPEDRVLHFGPEPAITDFVQPRAGTYETSDLIREDVDRNEDLQDLQLDDASVDLVICSHVMEHVPDDRKGFAEIFRVLKPGGTLFFMVPMVEGWAETYEVEGADAAFRALHFGQEDHMRFYGRDVRERLRAAGFSLEEYVATGLLALKHGLRKGECCFICRKPA